MRKGRWTDWPVVAVVFAVALGVGWYVGGDIAAQDKPPALTEVQQLRLELHQAHVQIADLQLRLAQAQLAMERQAVTLDVLKDKPGYEIDWQTLSLKKVEPPPKKE